MVVDDIELVENTKVGGCDFAYGKLGLRGQERILLAGGAFSFCFGFSLQARDPSNMKPDVVLRYDSLFGLYWLQGAAREGTHRGLGNALPERAGLDRRYGLVHCLFLPCIFR